MSELDPASAEKLIAAVERLADEQQTGNMIAFLDVMQRTGKSRDYNAALTRVRERLHIPTDRNPAP